MFVKKKKRWVCLSTGGPDHEDVVFRKFEEFTRGVKGRFWQKNPGRVQGCNGKEEGKGGEGVFKTFFQELGCVRHGKSPK